MSRRILLALAALLFSVLATANSGGYRYGVSDQAFYTAAVLKDLHPELYPRDTTLLEAESRLMTSDEIVARLSSVLRVDLPPLYLALYVTTVLLLFGAAVSFARAAGLSWWAIAAFLVVLTFRHRIARTGANSLEGYMHPRMLAFACGVFALAAVMKARQAAAVIWTAIAACWHPTTAFWFLIVVAVATFVDRPQWRRAMAAAGLAVALIAAWALIAGPLRGRLVIMDPAWLAVLSDKDYLFPHEWPMYAWAANLLYPLLIVAIYRRRAARGRCASGERALVAGLIALAAVFLVSFPFNIFRVALAVQAQVTRVFWILDFATAAYVCWWAADAWLQDRVAARRALVAVLLAASIGRGIYLLSQNRRLVEVDLPRSPWLDAMSWLRRAPPNVYVLADPGHAWKYGVSVRLAGEKDVLVEAGKDTALAMYDREVAMRVGDRLWALRDFNGLGASDFRGLASRYDVDVLIIERDHAFDLPVLYRNQQFVIYRLK